MGVDFYNCDKCNEIFDDCGHKYNSCEECGNRICFWCQVDMKMRSEAKYFSDGAKPIGDYWKDTGDGWYELIKCPYCDGTIVTDDEILTYLLDKLKTNKDDVIIEIKASRMK